MAAQGQRILAPSRSLDTRCYSCLQCQRTAQDPIVLFTSVFTAGIDQSQEETALELKTDIPGMIAPVLARPVNLQRDVPVAHVHANARCVAKPRQPRRR